VRERHLEDKFGALGELERVTVVKHPHTRESRGFAFVYFKSPAKAREALDRMQGDEMYGNNMKIELAKRSEPRPPRERR